MKNPKTKRSDYKRKNKNKLKLTDVPPICSVLSHQHLLLFTPVKPAYSKPLDMVPFLICETKKFLSFPLEDKFCYLSPLISIELFAQNYRVWDLFKALS